jgi:two-component system, cell cycle response regulator
MQHKYFRFHKTEISFLALTLLLIAASSTLFMAKIVLNASINASLIDVRKQLEIYIIVCALCLILAVVIAVFFIFPHIYRTLKEGEDLRIITHKLSVRSEILELTALTDALTGMQNRRYFDDALKEYLEEFQRIQKPIGLIVLDLDHFKRINDTHGHNVGDTVLREVAYCLKQFTRYHDIVARIGGEEFAIVAPNMEINGLYKFAERIRQAISSMVITSGSTRLKVSASIGIAVWDGSESQDDFYGRTDKMLYQAKHRGRNQVCGIDETEFFSDEQLRTAQEKIQQSVDQGVRERENVA